MRIGYARVSTSDQNLDLQKDALKRAGCEKIIEDVVSGKTESRSGLDRARDLLREGDVLVVWRLDRLGRSLKHLIELMSELEKQKIEFQSLQESIDTTMPGGKLIFHIFGVLAEFERNLISDRTKAGLEPQGRGGGVEAVPKSSTHSSENSQMTSITRKSTGSTKSAGRWASASRRCTLIFQAGEKPNSAD
jgi:DNA invertase Pin-like site-specific DNA recombinase